MNFFSMKEDEIRNNKLTQEAAEDRTKEEEERSGMSRKRKE